MKTAGLTAAAGGHVAVRGERTSFGRRVMGLLHGPASDTRVAAGVRFGWHFVQMAIAMMIGMAPFGAVLSALGRSDLDTRSPEAFALAMTAAMLLPMVAWMRVLGHAWGRTAEMATAMSAPVVVLAAGSLAGVLPHSAAVSAMNVAMWLGMLAAMLFRWPDYARRCDAG